MATPDPPNVLWLVAEDACPDFGCYGTDAVRTPNVDALAADGVRYDAAFATSPVCSPSRSALNTGLYQTAIDAHHHRSHRAEDPSGPNPLPAGVSLVSDRLRQAGYLTANVETFPDDVDVEAKGKRDWNFTYDGDPFDTDDWGALESADRPFFAQVTFPEAHRGDRWETASERVPHSVSPGDVDVPPYYPDHEVTRETWAAYLNAVQSLDVQVGRLRDRLAETGLASETLVVLLADHGRPTVRGKQWLYDAGLNVPLILSWPDDRPTPTGYEPGGVSDRLVSLVDVTAQTLAAAGLAVPDSMHGRPFLGPNAGPFREYVFAARDRCDETTDRIRSVRSRRFRYVCNYHPGRSRTARNRYTEANYDVLWLLRRLDREGALTPAQRAVVADERPEEELYDLADDPYEVRNLAGDPAYREVVRSMRRRLDEWVRETDDRGRFPEDPAVREFYEAKMREKYDEQVAAQRERFLGE